MPPLDPFKYFTQLSATNYIERLLVLLILVMHIYIYFNRSSIKIDWLILPSGAAGVSSLFFCEKAPVLGALGLITYTLSTLIILKILDVDLTWIVFFIIIHFLLSFIGVLLFLKDPNNASWYQGLVLSYLTLSLRFVFFLLKRIDTALAIEMIKNIKVFKNHLTWLSLFFLLSIAVCK